jgi:multiple sugar transport system permease protein
VTPFAIWILRDFFEKLPANLEEAAQVYGCSQFQAFYKVILPLSLPAVMATAFLAFLVGWNDFLFSNMLTTGTGPRPAVVSLYLQTVGGESRYWGLVMSQALVVGLPPTALYLVARRYLTESFAV